MPNIFFLTILVISFTSYFHLTKAEHVDDEPLAKIFKSLLPTDFIEKHAAQPTNHARKNAEDSAAKAENLLHGLDNIFQSLNAPDNGNCLYKCPNGAKPTPKPGYKTKPNGCGTHGFKPDVSSLPGLTDCCNEHDVCYGSCGKGQAECDRAFNACMFDSCQQMRNSGKIQTDKGLEECRAIGATFHLTVVSVGCQFYREAQAKACQCGNASASGGSAAQEKIRRHNEAARAREAAKSSTSMSDDFDAGLDFTSSMFDLPEAIEHEEL